MSKSDFTYELNNYKDLIISSVKSDAFEELRLKLNQYGVYKIYTKGYEPLFIEFYINKLSVSPTPTVPDANINAYTNKNNDSKISDNKYGALYIMTTTNIK